MTILLRKELIALSAKEKTRQCQGNYSKADSGSETNDKDYVFSILF
jgi:hypothetical protein